MSNGQVSHPELATLTAFAVGDLSENEAKDVEGHIAECETCCETLLNLENDTFVDLVVRSKDVQIESHEKTEDIHRSSAATPDSIDELDLLTELASHPRYRTVELLGRGGMGDVFKAEHRMMERTVALKVIKRELFRNPAAVQRFHREVKSAARLSHPNIVTAHDAEQAGDVNFLVMEYVEGVDLARRVKEEGALPINEACQYILQTALGLQHAHEQGMVHRDIKPHNLMVTGDGTLKILDFGLATFATEAITSEVGDEPCEDVAEKTSTSRLTTMGTMMGTPEFISPEQAGEPHAVDIRSDIYSLGCTFYYLLSGHAPFVAGSVMDKVKAHADQQAEPIENVRVDVPSEVADVVRRMMAKDPAQRFQTPDEVADALAPFVDAYRTRPAETGVSVHDSNSSSSERSWWPPTAFQSLTFAAFAFVLAGIIYVATDRGTLVVDSADDSVEIIIRSANGETEEGQGSHAQLRIVDTLTGSNAKRLPSGEYVLDLKGDANDYELSKDRFVLKRGDKVIVTVTPKMKPDGSGTTVRRVWSEPLFGGAPSPDGRFVSHPMGSDLAVRDLNTGTSRRLTKNTKSGEFAYIQVWSPNGKEIVTSWWLPDEHQFDLRIVPLDGGNPRTIYFDKEHYVHPFGWSNSGDVLTVREGSDHVVQLLLISAADGKARLLKSLGWNWPGFASISPDGRYVVYDMQQEDGSSNSDIFILSTEEGGSEEQLVEHPSNDYSPLWAPDGKRVVFTSDRNGSENLWALAVENGRPDGFPHSTNIDMTRARPRGIAQDGTYFYSHFSGKTDVYVAKFDPKRRLISGQSTKVTRRYEGFNSRPAWSRDGRYLAFVSDRGTEEDSNLVIQSIENNEQRVLNGSLNSFFNTRPRWSPDDKHILLSEGRDEKSRWVIDAIEVASGTITSLIPPTNDYNYRPSSAAWSSDGQTVLYIRNTFQKNTFVSKVAASTLGTNEERILHESTGSRRSDEYYPPKLYFSLAVSPNGEQLALASKNEICVMPVTGGDARIVHQVQQGRIPEAVGIVWTRDGRSIIFGTAKSRERAGGRLPQQSTRLWQVSIEDGSAIEIGLVVDNLSHIAMHPDGSQIAYTAAASGVSSEQQGTWTISDFLPPLAEKPEDSVSKDSARTSNMRRVFVSEGTPQLFGEIFLDGDSMSMVNWGNNGNLAIHELSTGQVRPVTHNKDWSDGYAYYSMPSPNGKRIACCWPVGSVNYCQLRVIDVDTGDHQTLYDNPDGAYLETCSWFPDGESIVVALDTDVNQLVLFSVKDGSHRTLKSLDWRWPETASVSPDGRYLVYDLQVQEDAPDRNLFIMATDGTSEIEITHPAIDAKPVWTPDGRGVVFTSDRGGSEGLWYLEVTDGQPRNEPELLVPHVRPGRPIGFTSDGSYYVKTRFTWRRGNVYVATVGEMKPDQAQAPRKAIQHDEGFQSLPCWSPDGKYLAYTLRGDYLVIRDMKTGRERKLRPSPFLRWRSWRPRWTPDGQSVVLGGSDSKGRWGLYSVNAQSGDVTPIIQGSVDDFSIPKFELSRYGTTAYYLRSSNIIARNLATEQETTLQESSGHVHSLALSPDGQQLACASDKVIDVLSTTDGTQRELVKVADGQVIPKHVGIAWAAADNSIVFASADAKSYHRNGLAPRSELWKVSIESGTAKSLGLEVDGLRQMSLHPDGQQIAYTIKPPGGAEVWALDNFLPSRSDAK